MLVQYSLKGRRYIASNGTTLKDENKNKQL